MTQQPKLLDRVRDAIRIRHYSRRTEDVYVQWVRRFILFHGKAHPSAMGSPHIEAFLASLAVDGHVSASTQNQALSAILFLYREVLHTNPGQVQPVARAVSPLHVSVVLTRSEVREILACLDGTCLLIVSLLYGAGLRLQECLELRIKDVDFERGELTCAAR